MSNIHSNILNEALLTPEELAERDKLIKNMMGNKRSLVKRYGSEAEKVMYGRATNMIINKNKKEIEKVELKTEKEIIDFFKSQYTEDGNIKNVAQDRIIPLNYPEARTRAEDEGYTLDKKNWGKAIEAHNLGKIK
jgi:hypothetical protein